MSALQSAHQNTWQQNQIVQFFDWIGQVMLQNNPTTGLISTLTAPFVLTAWIFLEAAYNFGHLFDSSS